MANTAGPPLYDDQARRDLQDRLGKIEGQVRGVGRMLNGQRPTQEVLQQLASIRSAVKELTKAVLRNYLERRAVLKKLIRRQTVLPADDEGLGEPLN